MALRRRRDCSCKAGRSGYTPRRSFSGSVSNAMTDTTCSSDYREEMQLSTASHHTAAPKRLPVNRNRRRLSVIFFSICTMLQVFDIQPVVAQYFPNNASSLSTQDVRGDNPLEWFQPKANELEGTGLSSSVEEIEETAEEESAPVSSSTSNSKSLNVINSAVNGEEYRQALDESSFILMEGQQLVVTNATRILGSTGATFPLFNALSWGGGGLFNPMGSGFDVMAYLASQMGSLTKSLSEGFASARQTAMNAFPILSNIKRNIIVSYQGFKPLRLVEMFAQRNKFIKTLNEALSPIIPVKSCYLSHLGMEIFEVPDPLGIVEFAQTVLGFHQFVDQVFEDQVIGPMEETSPPSTTTTLRNGSRTEDNSWDLEEEALRSGQPEEVPRETPATKRRLDATRVPNDPLFSKQWGSIDSDGMWGVEALRAWGTWTGEYMKEKFVVAVIDSGADLTHPDLQKNIWRNRKEICNNNIDDDGNGFIDDCVGWNFIAGNNTPMDDNGHGTASAGIIAAVANNGLGITGLCWGCEVMVLKALNHNIQGTVSGFVRAIDYAIANGAKVSNNSYGGRGSSFAGLKEAVRRADDAGMIFVAAAGNYRGNNDNDKDPVYPASYDYKNVIAVAASTRTGDLASFSSYGKASVDIAAPGVNVLTCAIGGGFRPVDGTSFAVPYLAGAAALIWSREPWLTYGEVVDRIFTYKKPSPYLAGRVRTGGIVDIWAAMTMNGQNLNALKPRPGSTCASKNACHKDAKCVDTENGPQCTCKKGYQGNGIVCDDINECDFNPCGPAASCVNLPGSFKCECNPGFQQIGDTCQDVNECEANPRVCPHNSQCVNFVGNFDCFCPAGSVWNSLHGEEGRCLRINSPNNGPCMNNGNCGINTLCKARGNFWMQNRECECLNGYVALGKYDSCVRPGILREHIPYYVDVAQRSQLANTSPSGNSLYMQSIQPSYGTAYPGDVSDASYVRRQAPPEPNTSPTSSRQSPCMFGICLFGMGKEPS